MKIKNRHLTALTCASLLGTSALSQAALTIGDIVSVNITASNISYVLPTGAAVIGATGNQWNELKASSGSSIGTLGTVALKNVSGTPSGASLAVNAGFFNGSATAPQLDVYRGNAYLDGNGQFGPAGPATITLTGLGAGTIIDLYLYAGAGHTVGEGATFTFGSAQSVSDSNGTETAYALGTNYTLFSGLVANGSGTITGTWSRNAGAGQRFSSFSGLQFAVVPEPSTALLGGLGLLALLRRRR